MKLNKLKVTGFFAITLFTAGLLLTACNSSKEQEAPLAEGQEEEAAFPFFINVAYAVVNFTMSRGLSVSPVCPPMVPRMPEIDLISVISRSYVGN